VLCVEHFFKTYENVIIYHYNNLSTSPSPRLYTIYQVTPTRASRLNVSFIRKYCGNDSRRKDSVRCWRGCAGRKTRNTRRQNERNIAFPHGVTCQIGLRKSYDDDGCGSLNTTSGKWWGREGTEKKKKSARRRRRFQSSVLIAVQSFWRLTVARGGRRYRYCIVFQRAEKCARDKMRDATAGTCLPIYRIYIYIYK